MAISENSNDLYVQLPLLTLFKIVIIAFTGFTLFANFYPYYTDVDSLFYGVNTLAIAEGNYEYTNDLLKETGKWEFIPVQWTKSIYNTAIPTTSVGFFAFSTPAFLLGGFTGLFYLGPIIAVALLIVSERVSTKLFGKYVGLFTVVLLATDFLVYRMGQQLMTDNLFAIFIILGFYYLIIFLHNKKSSSILFSSIFLTIATFIRPTSIVFLSSEILILAGYSLFHIYQNTRNTSYSQLHYFNKVLFFKTIFFQIKSKKFFKIAILMLIPWVVFVFFYFGYNDYYFGDSATNYISVRQDTLADKRDPLSLFFTLDSERFEFIKSYSVSLLPDSIRSILLDLSGNDSMSFLGSNWLSVFSFIIFGAALLLSIYDKNKRIEIFSLSIFVLSFLVFLSSPHIWNYNSKK